MIKIEQTEGNRVRNIIREFKKQDVFIKYEKLHQKECRDPKSYWLAVNYIEKNTIEIREFSEYFNNVLVVLSIGNSSCYIKSESATILALKLSEMLNKEKLTKIETIYSDW